MRKEPETLGLLWGLIIGFVFTFIAGLSSYDAGYAQGLRVGGLEVLASRGCASDYECEVLVDDAP